MKSFSDLVDLKTFKERFDYLSLNGELFQSFPEESRYLKQALYQSSEWRSTRRKVVIRDNGCDLACEDYPINGKIYIHHINPIAVYDIQNRNPILFDLDNLVCVSYDTHTALHYGLEPVALVSPIVRTKNDTTPWKR